MIPYRVLAVAPVAWTAAVLALEVTLRGTPGREWLLLLHQRGTLLLAAGAAWAAARAFQPGDRMRSAWLLLAALWAFIAGSEVVARTGGPGAGPVLQGVLVVGANVFGVAGTWILARTWRVASLELDLGGGARRAVQALAFGLAAAVTVPAIASAAPGAMAGEGAALVNLASSVGDLLVFAMLAPILLTAISLRGGVVAWPWALLAAAAAVWIGVDGVTALGPWAGVEPGATGTASALLQGLAILYEAAAGLAQRQVVEQLRDGVAAGPP